LNNVVTTQHLTKIYGHIRAVDDLCLEIPEKSVFGILGPNGSGKTTTLGMLLDVINPTSGTYSWFGNYSRKENRQKIGSILETPAFYPYLSAVDNLKIIAEIKTIGYASIDEVLQTVGLFERRHSMYRTYSLGMKQRLALASALLCDPLVMILDEPTNGLDPKGIAEMRDLIRNIARQGKTIILASHLLDEVQKVCSHFAVLNRGKLLYTGLVNEVVEDEQRIEISADDTNRLYDLLGNYPGKKQLETEGDRIIITIAGDIPVSGLSQYLFEHGVAPTHLVSLHRSLEKQFLDILNVSGK
jgi:ABC-type multidrug transport system ATPase subunit